MCWGATAAAGREKAEDSGMRKVRVVERCMVRLKVRT